MLNTLHRTFCEDSSALNNSMHIIHTNELIATKDKAENAYILMVKAKLGVDSCGIGECSYQIVSERVYFVCMR